MKKILFTSIFLLSTFLFVLCLTKFVFSFHYTSKKGDKYYHTSVSENVIIFNYGKNVKKIEYCFTKEDNCNDYLEYEADLSKRIINVSIDYSDSIEEQRICVNIVTNNNRIFNCSEKSYVVDSTSPIITSLYNEIILYEEKDDIESLFKAESVSGIKDFNCDYDKDVVKCRATSKNGLVTDYEQKIYLNEKSILEGKKVLFAGDSITEASWTFDHFGGWASRVGFDNYMDWYNSGKGGSTIAKVKGRSHITDQIIDRKEDEYDYIILQGGINDMHAGIELGEITDSFDVEDFDNETFAGGLEELFYYTKKYNENSKIGFIITYQTPNSDWGNEVRDRSSQTALIREICDKWNIPYLDLYDGSLFEDGESKTYSEILQVETGECFHGKSPKQVHLSNKGYDIISKYISIWMRTI